MERKTALHLNRLFFKGRLAPVIKSFACGKNLRIANVFPRKTYHGKPLKIFRIFTFLLVLLQISYIITNSLKKGKLKTKKFRYFHLCYFFTIPASFFVKIRPALADNNTWEGQ